MTTKDGWQGRFFEDFEPGDVYQHPIGRTISEADNGVEVCSYLRTFYVYKRGQHPLDHVFPAAERPLSLETESP